MTVVPFPARRQPQAAPAGDDLRSPLRPAQDLFALVPPGAVTAAITVEIDGATLARLTAEAARCRATTEELAATVLEAICRRRLWTVLLGDEEPA